MGSFCANVWGLHDMHGTVREWCLDPWHGSYEGAPADGSAWMEGWAGSRLLRGGSWNNHPASCLSASRYNNHLVRRSDIIGFRVCCLPQD